MLSNNVIGSARGLYPNQNGIWTSSRCWHFQAGSYIRHNITEEFIRNTTGDYTIAGWFYFPNAAIADYAVDADNDVSLDSTVFGFSYQTPIEDGSIEMKGYGSTFLHRGFASYNFHYKLRAYCDGGGSGLSHILGGGGNMPHEQWIFIVSRVKTSDVSDDNCKTYIGRNTSQSNPFLTSAATTPYSPISNITNFKFIIGGTKSSFYISELGIWKDNLPDVQILSLYNNGSPVDFSNNHENYNSTSDLVAYYRFGDGGGDNPSSFLHDETNSANTASESNGDRDIGSSSIIGTLHEVDTVSIGLNYE